MQNKHGFFILDENYCKDVKGLFNYLAEKIFTKKCCIHFDYNKCGNFKTGQSVQLHMVDKNHCFMNQDMFGEYEKFYDFSKANLEMAKKLEEKYKNSKGGLEFEYEVAIQDDNDEWVDVDSDEDAEIKETKPKEAHTQRKIFKLRRPKMLDTDELLLPSGKIAGHKKYTSIYKQRPIIKQADQLKVLENGRAVYTGKKTYEASVLLENGNSQTETGNSSNGGSK